jgi:demethoxyubiquinone hydroxylase (CLK1/Coq7/Cat5 family)
MGDRESPRGFNKTFAIVGSVVATFITILTFLNSEHVSQDSFDDLKSSINKHVLEYDNETKNIKDIIESSENKLRQEIKQMRIEQLVWQNKLLIAKGEANLSEYDKVVMELIKLELDTLRGRVVN